MQAWYQVSEACIEHEIPFQLFMEKSPKGTFQIVPSVRHIACTITAAIREERLNVIWWIRLCYSEKDAMIIAIDALLIICTLLTLNRELTNLIQNPAMRLRTRINRGIQAGKRSHRTIRKAQNVEIYVEPWIEKRALINSHRHLPEPSYLWQIQFY